jgi:hypothetical protein
MTDYSTIDSDSLLALAGDDEVVTQLRTCATSPCPPAGPSR